MITLSDEDIERVINSFINAAVLSAEAGFKMIQLHSTHVYLEYSFANLLMR